MTTTTVRTRPLSVDKLILGDVIWYHNRRWILWGMQIEEFGALAGRELTLRDSEGNQLVEFFCNLDELTIEL
jgi:hypothetical protein